MPLILDDDDPRPIHPSRAVPPSRDILMSTIEGGRITKYVSVPLAFTITQIRHAELLCLFATFSNGRTWLSMRLAEDRSILKRLFLMPADVEDPEDDIHQEKLERAEDYEVMSPEELNAILSVSPRLDDLEFRQRQLQLDRPLALPPEWMVTRRLQKGWILDEPPGETEVMPLPLVRSDMGDVFREMSEARLSGIEIPSDHQFIDDSNASTYASHLDSESSVGVYTPTSGASVTDPYEDSDARQILTGYTDVESSLSFGVYTPSEQTTVTETDGSDRSMTMAQRTPSDSDSQSEAFYSVTEI